MAFILCCRPWTTEDAAADADERQSTAASLQGKGKDDDVEIGAASVGTRSNEGGEAAHEVTGNAEPVDEDEQERPAGIASAINVEKVGSPKEAAAPSSASSVVLALPEAEAVKRVDDNLMEGGLLLAQVMGGGRKMIRKLEVDDEDRGVLRWETEALFGMKTERVKLSEARIMCTGTLVKVVVEGRRDFISFEACDEGEAAAVCNALIRHGEQNVTKDI